MARRSTSTTRTLLPLDRGDWQDEDTELKAPVADGDEDDAEPVDEGDSEAAVDLDESDELATDDTAVLAAVDTIGDPVLDPGVEALMAELEADTSPASRQAARRAPGGARRQVEDYWERKRVARAIEDLEDFEV